MLRHRARFFSRWAAEPRHNDSESQLHPGHGILQVVRGAGTLRGCLIRIGTVKPATISESSRFVLTIRRILSTPSGTLFSDAQSQRQTRIDRIGAAELLEPVFTWFIPDDFGNRRQHRLQATTSHQWLLLTSDQGLARMALAEGIDPLCFHSTNQDTFRDEHFTGVNCHPFKENLHSTSIPAILWDLATVAGAERLESTEGIKPKLEVWATRNNPPWLPQHSREDLLWTARGTPLVRTVYLNRGDFLIPEKASASIRLERTD